MLGRPYAPVIINRLTNGIFSATVDVVVRRPVERVGNHVRGYDNVRGRDHRHRDAVRAGDVPADGYFHHVGVIQAGGID